MEPARQETSTHALYGVTKLQGLSSIQFGAPGLLPGERNLSSMVKLRLWRKCPKGIGSGLQFGWCPSPMKQMELAFMVSGHEVVSTAVSFVRFFLMACRRWDRHRRKSWKFWRRLSRWPWQRHISPPLGPSPWGRCILDDERKTQPSQDRLLQRVPHVWIRMERGLPFYLYW